MFDNILNWQLLAGSHDFPGPSGGTCINEAAIVAAGFEYQQILTSNDMPECFSRPISSLAMSLNDYLPNDKRQRLIKYVYRLSGTKDELLIENKRKKIIRDMMYAGMLRIVTEIEDPLFAEFRQEWIDVLNDETKRASMVLYGELIHELRLAVFTIFDDPLQIAMRRQEAADDVIEQLAQLGTDVLDAVLAIGNRAEPIEPALICTRLENAKVIA